MDIQILRSCRFSGVDYSSGLYTAALGNTYPDATASFLVAQGVAKTLTPQGKVFPLQGYISPNDTSISIVNPNGGLSGVGSLYDRLASNFLNKIKRNKYDNGNHPNPPVVTATASTTTTNPFYYYVGTTITNPQVYKLTGTTATHQAYFTEIQGGSDYIGIYDCRTTSGLPVWPNIKSGHTVYEFSTDAPYLSFGVRASNVSWGISVDGYSLSLLGTVQQSTGFINIDWTGTSIGVGNAAIVSGGTGYAVGDYFSMNLGTGSGTSTAKLCVTKITAGGVIAGLSISETGIYTVAPQNVAGNTTNIIGTGTGAQINCTLQTVLPTANARKMRTYRISAPQLAGFRGVTVNDNDTVLQVPQVKTDPVILVMGDSYTEGSLGGVSGVVSTNNNFITAMQEISGCNIVSQGIGASGYQAGISLSSANQFRFEDAGKVNPDAIAILLGTNDTDYTAQSPTYIAAITYAIQQLQLIYPTIPITVFGIWSMTANASRTGVPSSFSNREGCIATAVSNINSRIVTFVPLNSMTNSDSPWVYGTGSGYTGTGNASMIMGDSAHPSLLYGSEYIARQVIQSLLKTYKSINV